MTETDDGYKEWRVSSDGMRLSLQHYVFRDHLGYNLHPAVKIEGDGPIYVADVAAGSCLWSLQVAEQLGSKCQIEALDMDLGLCPPDPMLPPNVHVRGWNFFEPVPDDLIGKFDIVHIRLVVAATVGQKDMVPVLEKLVSMLKPGGYLQWDEYDYDPSTPCIKYVADPSKFPDPAKSHPAPTKFYHNILQAFDWNTEFFTYLPDRMKSAGLGDIVQDARQEINSSARRAFYEAWVAGFAVQMVDVFEKIDPERAKEQKKLVEQIRRGEKEDGVIFYGLLKIVVGRKKK